MFGGIARYLDPGTGSMILQYLAAAFLTVLVIIRLKFKKIMKKIKQMPEQL